MIAYEGYLARQYSYSDLKEIERLLKYENVSNFDRDAFLAVLPD